MGYELVGYGGDFGSVGADIVGDDLLQALGVSGNVASYISGLGNTELVGADIVGAAQNPRHPAHHAARAHLKQQAERHIAMRHAKMVTQTALDKGRRYPLGFVPTTLPASTTALIPAAPQNLFRAERLVIPSDIAFDIGVVDVKVGNQSQLVQSVEVPAAVFSEVAIDTHVTFDTAEVGNQISVQARNKLTTGPVDFTAAMIGSIAK